MTFVQQARLCLGSPVDSHIGFYRADDVGFRLRAAGGTQDGCEGGCDLEFRNHGCLFLPCDLLFQDAVFVGLLEMSIVTDENTAIYSKILILYDANL